MAGSITDWDSKVVIGSKARSANRVSSEHDTNAAKKSGSGIDGERKVGTGNKAHADPDHQVSFALRD